MELQLGVRLPFPEPPQGVRDDAMPGGVFREAYAQRPRLTAGHPGSARSSLIHLLENAPRIFQEQFAGRAQLHATREALEQFEADFVFQILNLTRKRRLSHT